MSSKFWKQNNSFTFIKLFIQGDGTALEQLLWKNNKNLFALRFKSEFSLRLSYLIRKTLAQIDGTVLNKTTTWGTISLRFQRI